MKVYFAGPLFTPYERRYIDECAAQLRADNFEVFVPHEHELAVDVDVTAAWILSKDRPGVEGANAMLTLIGDDGTACEIGMFHALMQSDDSKENSRPAHRHPRPPGRASGSALVQGAIEDVGGTSTR